MDTSNNSNNSAGNIENNQAKSGSKRSFDIAFLAGSSKVENSAPDSATG